MKQIKILFAALAIIGSASAFSTFSVNPEPIPDLLEKNRTAARNVEVTNERVTTAFTAKFRQAEKITWKQVNEFYFANFEMKNRQYAAAYTGNGEMIALSRTLTAEQLPLVVVAALEERFEGYKMPAEITEIIMDGSTCYYLTLENAARFVQLKCSAEGSITVNKKIKKKILVGSVS